jgi:positive regulator of sigma E activity
MLAYLMPLFCMILVAIAAQYLMDTYTAYRGELPQVIGGLLGLIGGFFLLKLLAFKNRHDPDYQAVMLRHADRVSVPFV